MITRVLLKKLYVLSEVAVIDQKDLCYKNPTSERSNIYKPQR